MDSKKKNILVINLTSGLCNQLNSIAKAIILASIDNRDLYFQSFQIHYDINNNKLNTNEIINIDKLQEIINYLELDVKIYKNIDIKEDKIIDLNVNNQDYSYLEDFTSYLKKQKEDSFLNIGSPICAKIPEKYKDALDKIILNIQFTEKFITYSSRIKETFHLQNYICVHLRMEDDCLEYMVKLLKNKSYKKVEDIYKEKYTSLFKELSNYKVKIYICTSLCIYENKNNIFYQELKKKYNLIDKNDLLLSMNLGNNDSKCRELYGIIDYLIAKDSTYFVGCDWSSFSILLYNNHKFYKKNTKLIDLWKSCLES